MRQLVQAIQKYENANGHLPMVSRPGSDGETKQSWRVQILPFLASQSLYELYDFSEPWDGPGNRMLLDQMPEVFRCPFSLEGTRTNYKLVVGPGTLFDGKERTWLDVEDGLSNTYALIEDSVDPVEWTRPSDVSVDEAVAILEDREPGNLPHKWETKYGTSVSSGNIALLDSMVMRAPSFDPDFREESKKYFGISDGVGRHAQESLLIVRGHRSPRIGFLLFVFLMLYPLSWVFRIDSEPKGE